MNSINLIKNLKDHAGKTVTLRGWLLGKRSSGKVAFLQLRDGTGVCQCIVEASAEAAFAEAKELTQESSLMVTGEVHLDERAPGGAELIVCDLIRIHQAEEYPITRKAHGSDFLMHHRHLWLRSPRQASILRIRHRIITAARDFFDRRGFTLIDTPLLQPGAAEGAGTLFPVDFFGEEVYLAQTGQLYLESAAMALGKVYCFGPTFRAEKSKTRRHLTEFWMIEPEIAFAELPDLEQLAEEFIESIVQSVLEHHRDDLDKLERDTAPLEAVKAPFPRMTYSDAVELLRSDEIAAELRDEQVLDEKRLKEEQANLHRMEKELEAVSKAWKRDKLARDITTLRETIRETEARLTNRPEHMEQVRSFQWGKDLGGAEETILCRRFDRPLIVTEYPREAKAFYMKRSDSDPRVVRNLDVLAPEGYGEIIGGSQREEDLDLIMERIKAEDMDPAAYEWYLDLRRYGSVPHGGFGLGIERTVAWICGLKHIRETIPFPRLMGRMYP